MASFEMDDRKKIGLGLTGFGIFFTILGVIFLFDKGLLAMGNILFLAGVALTIGPKSALGFFMKPQNFKGTISFGVGFFLVIIGWPIIGMILELYGFIVLFSGFWPTLAVFLQRIPVLGWVLQHPLFRSWQNPVPSNWYQSRQSGTVVMASMTNTQRMDAMESEISALDSKITQAITAAMGVIEQRFTQQTTEAIEKSTQQLRSEIMVLSQKIGVNSTEQGGSHPTQEERPVNSALAEPPVSATEERSLFLTLTQKPVTQATIQGGRLSFAVAQTEKEFVELGFDNPLAPPIPATGERNSGELRSSWRRTQDRAKPSGVNPIGWKGPRVGWILHGHRGKEGNGREAATLVCDRRLGVQRQRRRGRVVGWEELKGLLLCKFRPSACGISHKRWLTHQHLSPAVADYRRKFMGQYSNGLKVEIRAKIRLFRPLNLGVTMGLSLKVEEEVRFGPRSRFESKALGEWKINISPNFKQHSGQYFSGLEAAVGTKVCGLISLNSRTTKGQISVDVVFYYRPP